MHEMDIDILQSDSQILNLFDRFLFHTCKMEKVNESEITRATACQHVNQINHNFHFHAFSAANSKLLLAGNAQRGERKTVPLSQKHKPSINLSTLLKKIKNH